MEAWRAREDDVDAINAARCGDPFAVLGPHLTSDGWVIRVFAPDAWRVRALTRDGQLARASCRGARATSSRRWFPPPRSGRSIASRSKRRREPRPISTPTPSGRRSGRWTTTCCSRARTGSSIGGWARSSRTHEGVDGVLFALWAPERARASRWSATSTTGTAGAARCASASTAACGRSSFPHLGAGAVYKYELAGPDGDLLPLKADPFGFEAELRPSTASVVADTADFAWTDADYMARRAKAEPRRKPMSIYEVHLGSWRRAPDGGFLTYDELADQLIPYVADLGFTHLELLPISEHPLDESWGYQPIGLFAPTAPLRRARRLRPLRRPGPRRRPRRHPRLGAGAFPDRRARAGALRRHGALRARRSAQGLPPRLEHRDLQFRPARGRELPLLPTRSTGSTASTSTACASTRSPRCSTSTIRAAPGEWLPNPDGSNENREAIAFLQRANEARLRRLPRRGHHRRGIDGLPRRVAADRRRRPRLRLQVEHGLDARHARLHVARSDLSPLEPRQDDVRAPLRLQREFRPADLARRGRARQRLAGRQDARRRMAALRQRRAPTTASCGAIRARSCCSWARSSARRWSGTPPSRCPGGCSTTGRTRACRR